MKRLLAQSLSLPGGESIEGPSGIASNFPSIGSVINRAVVLIIAFAGMGLLVMIISAGFSMLTSAGDPKKLEAGKSRLTNGLAGFFLVVAAFWIVQIVGAILGFEQIISVFQVFP